MLRAKRIYEDPEPDDGLRVLVDRLWPRGIGKEAAEIDRWLKAIAPSHDLRAWFGHDPDRWEAFRERYAAELEADEEADEALAWLAEQVETHETVTLLYAAKDTEHNNAVALKLHLEATSE